MMKRTILCAFMALAAMTTYAQVFDPLTISDNDITFAAYPNGDRVPDFSFCGYLAGGAAIPDLLADPSVPVVKVPSSSKDATQTIQDAIDYVSRLPILSNGFRGVVLLGSGVHNVSGVVRIASSGVVLRGEGASTILKGCGVDRETLVRIEGKDDRSYGDSIPFAGDYLPVGSTVIPVKEGHGFKPGQQVRITRPSTEAWIKAIGTDRIGRFADYSNPAWKEGDFDLNFDRTVVEVGTSSITVDVPIPQSFEACYGGAYVRSYSWNGRIERSAVENLVLESEYEQGMPKDEDHRWMAISIDNASDCWVRRVTARHFVSSAVCVLPEASRITVEECRSLEPVGEIGGYRRIAFQTYGQQTFFNRCYSENGYHDFAVGASTAGPNAFVQCWASGAHGFSGALGGWSCGTLFDRVTVDNAPIKFSYLDLDLQGGGWSSANSLCWQCRAPQIHIDDAPGAHNWAYGSRGQGYGRGSHAQHSVVRPEYFYYTQYIQRNGAAPDGELDKVIRYNPDFSKTDAAFAARESERALEPAWTIDRWIDTLEVRHPLMATTDRGIDINSVIVMHEARPGKKRHIIDFKGGRIKVDGSYLAGRNMRTALWSGTVRPSAVNTAGVHLTRFVPGRDGTGFTDVMAEIPSKLDKAGANMLSHFPALWYERRRDDHGRLIRADADVWAPFYEQPFGRSGIGEANDRLSLYDLNRWNKWYWNRLQQFADIADEHGYAFMSEHYLQHNIIEEGAHWVDYPWRDMNNVNDVDLPEPTYMQGDKRVFMATQFYDLNNEKLKAFHVKYIRKNLELAGENVIHHIGAEYTGPEHFMRFWLETIKNWEKENGKNVAVALNATRDVMEAVLADPSLCEEVDVIDLRQWYYCSDGSIYDPEGGVSLAPRQYARVMDTGSTDLSCVWRMVREYRTRFPEKAVWMNNYRMPGSAWVAFLAGASLCQTPKEIEAEGFYKKALLMQPMDAISGNGVWVMGRPGTGYIAYSNKQSFKLDLSSDRKSYKLSWIDQSSGKLLGSSRVRGGSVISLEAPVEGAVAYLK